MHPDDGWDNMLIEFWSSFTFPTLALVRGLPIFQSNVRIYALLRLQPLISPIYPWIPIDALGVPSTTHTKTHTEKTHRKTGTEGCCRYPTDHEAWTSVAEHVLLHARAYTHSHAHTRSLKRSHTHTLWHPLAHAHTHTRKLHSTLGNRLSGSMDFYYWNPNLIFH